MGADKTDKDISHHELNHNYKPIVITLNVKDIMLIANRVHTTKIIFNIRETGPLSRFSNLIPPL